MDTKYEKAIEILMKHFGLVWYNDKWMPAEEAYWRESQDIPKTDKTTEDPT